MTTYRVQSDGIPVIDKSPTAVLDYIVDLLAEDPGPWLEDGEFVTSAIGIADPGLTLVTATPAPVDAPTRIVVWLTDGTIGTTYLVKVTFTTSKDRTDTRSFRVRVVLR